MLPPLARRCRGRQNSACGIKQQQKVSAPRRSAYDRGAPSRLPRKIERLPVLSHVRAEIDVPLVMPRPHRVSE
ncbi:hypothetical protein BOTBODRAFT_581421 [Botryobasidium botryosum FD-172 SS1]|uniref:Uncharacterized protein n=1 Tax=Botryobasidium botryosum (strain FD-172 SS1) TaxID=930990 RepID=A0A067MQ61_BOTB1|nr:hypothetical protein BOTBODRAFT_581421 [Botryobasidium botryosum FD-172 SS1]